MKIEQGMKYFILLVLGVFFVVLTYPFKIQAQQPTFGPICDEQVPCTPTPLPSATTVPPTTIPTSTPVPTNTPQPTATKIPPRSGSTETTATLLILGILLLLGGITGFSSFSIISQNKK